MKSKRPLGRNNLDKALHRLFPDDVVMHPFSIKVNYAGKPWCTVDLELGHNEIGDADEVELCESSEVNAAFGRLGFPIPGKVPVMPLRHQIAQKLHGASEPGSERAHDLVDLQLIFKRSKINLSEVRQVCERIFAYRKMQPWPSRVVANERWRDLYATAAEGLPVLPTVDEAVAWTNELIAKIAVST